MLGLLLGLLAPAQAEIYRYVDPNGRVHFTNVPIGPGWELYFPAPKRSRRIRGYYRPRIYSSSHWDRLFEEVARQEGLSPALLKAIARVESAFDPQAVSPKGALGLMQLMPETARIVGVRDPFDPQENVKGAARFLKYLLQEFGSLEEALAAYHAGPEVVKRYGGLPPYPETRRYVRSVLKYFRAYQP